MFSLIMCCMLFACSVSSTVKAIRKRSDDINLPELQNVIVQQSVEIQTLQAKVTSMDSTIKQQSAVIQTLQSKVTSMGDNMTSMGDTMSSMRETMTSTDNTMQQQSAVIQTLQAKVTSMDSTIKQQSAVIQTLQSKVTSMGDKMTSMDNTMQQQSAVIQTLQSKVTSMGDKMTSMDNTKNQQSAVIQTLQAKLTAVDSKLTKHVAFSVNFNPLTLGDEYVNISQGGVITFANIVSNPGGGYNATTGEFTAPVAGTYGFYLSIRSDNTHDYIVVALKKNTLDLCYSVVEGNEEHFDKGACFSTTHLNVGDKVLARQIEGDTYLEEWRFTTFSGFLVLAD